MAALSAAFPAGHRIPYDSKFKPEITKRTNSRYSKALAINCTFAVVCCVFNIIPSGRSLLETATISLFHRKQSSVCDARPLSAGEYSKMPCQCSLFHSNPSEYRKIMDRMSVTVYKVHASENATEDVLKDTVSRVFQEQIRISQRSPSLA
jgi:hypothetical protein